MFFFFGGKRKNQIVLSNHDPPLHTHTHTTNKHDYWVITKYRPTLRVRLISFFFFLNFFTAFSLFTTRDKCGTLIRIFSIGKKKGIFRFIKKKLLNMMGLERVFLRGSMGAKIPSLDYRFLVIYNNIYIATHTHREKNGLLPDYIIK